MLPVGWNNKSIILKLENMVTKLINLTNSIYVIWQAINNTIDYAFSTSEKAKKEREKERREQYKQVRAHVCKESDGRLQAYGWSLPAKLQPHVLKEAPSKNQVPVPVPVYCRPLLDKQSGLKVIL